MYVRSATPNDLEAVQSVHRAAFPESERELVAKLAVDLLLENTDPPTISLVGEDNDAVIAHTAFSPVTLVKQDNLQGYILAPVGVAPEHQKCGVGSQLIEHGIEQLSEKGTDIVFVYGDPKYYRRFGFSTDAAERFLPPYELEFPFGWQAMEFKEMDTGELPVQIVCIGPLSDPELW